MLSGSSVSAKVEVTEHNMAKLYLPSRKSYFEKADIFVHCIKTNNKLYIKFNYTQIISNVLYEHQKQLYLQVSDKRVGLMYSAAI